jgi:hypothetical protein
LNCLNLFDSESSQRLLETEKQEGMNILHHTCGDALFQ